MAIAFALPWAKCLIPIIEVALCPSSIRIDAVTIIPGSGGLEIRVYSSFNELLQKETTALPTNLTVHGESVLGESEWEEFMF